MIITVTLNPAMDKTLVIDQLVPGETNRVKDARTDPGGKGINVSRVLRVLGQSSLAVGFVSGSVGRFVEASLNEMGILDDFIHTPGQTRTNIAIVEEKRRITTLLSEKGPATDPHYLSALKERLRVHIAPGTWTVLAGSLPPRIKPGVYAELTSLAREMGGLAALDADGEPLALGVAAKPHLIKPNRHELESLIGRTLASDEDVLGAAREIHASGVAIVVVSMGAQGAIAVSDQGTWKAMPPKVEPRSTVGAGDSLLAGVVLGLSTGKGLVEGLRLGTAAGAATALTSGTQLCHQPDIDRLLPEVRIEKL
ncbi:MAG: 1-phosphofructokinase [Chloroflexi bacterium]|nr:1-phosphofructokinase [Chloroflexota bacterium]